MKDPRHKAAVIRVHEALRVDGMRLPNKVVDRIAAAALQDDTEHDVTRLNPERTEARMADPLGTVYVELQVTSRRALSLLVAGWTDEEKALLLAGDKEARENLIQDMQIWAMRHPHEVNVAVVDIRMRDGEDASVTS